MIYAQILPVDARVVTGVFAAVFGLFIYNTFGIGCPKCGKRLGLMQNWGGLRRGLPGRYCTHCHADLSVRSLD
ncbi:hypothetical protein [Phenylobacterium sp.]|uniref:hypothetical protein n=1 Tax=Phenylobacterium sp. TaxID=1871053 RepID=UPI003566EE6F